ncbi:hypothetical protein [Pseudohongiella acticola]|jgi:uncharacterized protein (DUF2062 family)|uniref:hypothetical protein n=1 Tax=Pseudohongiella acticola TaxID=1524254 RepID=UPI0030EBB72D
MKNELRNLCRPVLAFFEKGEPADSYRASHRKILLAVAVLFLVLFGLSLYLAFAAGQFAALIPVGVFFVVSMVALIVASLGTDAAVSRIWGLK